MRYKRIVIGNSYFRFLVFLLFSLHVIVSLCAREQRMITGEVMFVQRLQNVQFYSYTIQLQYFLLTTPHKGFFSDNLQF